MDRSVFVNPGHGGKDPGAVGNGLFEDDLNLDIANRVKPKLEAYGIRAITNRTNDRFDPLATICAKANSSDAGIFVAIHCNSTGEATHGFEEIYVSGTGKRVCDSINARLAPLSPTPDVGPYADRRGLAVLHGTNMPAAVVECMSVSAGSEAKLLSDPAFREEIAQAIVDGIRDFFDGVAAAPAPVPAPTSGMLLKSGSIGGDVRNLQHELVRHGFSRMHVDGDFGGQTDFAVRAFQRYAGIGIDGVVCRDTRGKLAGAAIVRAAMPRVAYAPKRVVAAVRTLQDALNDIAGTDLKPDGKFGDKTRHAVIDFQRHARLDDDGVVGPDTWRALGYR